MVSRIVNPGLRARIADVAWSNNRRDGKSAAAAIDAYCDVVEGLLAGTWKHQHDRNAASAAIKFIHRALQIGYATSKRGTLPAEVRTIFEQMYDAARDEPDTANFRELAVIAMSYGIRQRIDVAPELERVATNCPGGTAPWIVKAAWDLAANIYESAENEEARQRCLIGAVEQTLLMRKDVAGRAAAEASHVMDALQQLRHVKGLVDRKAALEIELRDLQKASIEQMGTFKIDLRVDETRDRVEQHFDQLSLPDSLRVFVVLDSSRDPAKLREEALEQANAAPLMAMMSAVHMDDEGRIVSRSAGASLTGGEPDESWFRRTIGQSERLHRHHVVAGLIEPARVLINVRFGITERHFEAMLRYSGFVPEEQKPLLALGFARFFQGDMMSATHLLIPQLEPGLRNLLKQHGIDPTGRRDDATEQDLSISTLFQKHGAQLEKVLTAPLASEINQLFNARPGPALRHELAHGQISGGACFAPDVYYANWLIYRLAFVPLLAVWDDVIAPQLALAE